MAEQQPIGRRTVFGFLVVVLAVCAAGSVASAPRDEESPPSEAGHKRSRHRIYQGTVDRIVDGTHVVVLIEDGGCVVDQHVVPAGAYPDLEEGDRVTAIRDRGRLSLDRTSRTRVNREPNGAAVGTAPSESSRTPTNAETDWRIVANRPDRSTY